MSATENTRLMASSGGRDLEHSDGINNRCVVMLSFVSSAKSNRLI